jgi:hypothetical protein
MKNAVFLQTPRDVTSQKTAFFRILFINSMHITRSYKAKTHWLRNTEVILFSCVFPALQISKLIFLTVEGLKLGVYTLKFTRQNVKYRLRLFKTTNEF